MSPERKKEKFFDLEESFDKAKLGLIDELRRAHVASFSIVQFEDRGIDITKNGGIRRRLGKNKPVQIMDSARSYVDNYFIIKEPKSAYHKQIYIEGALLNTSMRVLRDEKLQKEAIEVLNDAWRKAKKLPDKHTT